jgi:mercuric ion transport protein
MNQDRKDGLSVLGMGAAACVACCAGPLLAILGGLSLAGLASTLLIGTAGLVIAAVALAALLVARRRRNDCPVSDDSPTPVAAPTRRPADLSRSAP